jgi:exonuclease III
MGDFNFVLRPEVDVIPAAPSASNTRNQASINSSEALNELVDHLGGLMDAFRVVHPDRPAATHLPGGPPTDAAGKPRTQRRLDRIYLSPDLILNMPALTDVQTIDQLQLATFDRIGKSIFSDHAGVTATLRFSDI